MAQTAVEQFLNAIKDQINLSQEHLEMIESYASQAKEMEKEQNIDFARHCLNKAKDLDILTAFMNVEQYYNETYKNK